MSLELSDIIQISPRFRLPIIFKFCLNIFLGVQDL